MVSPRTIFIIIFALIAAAILFFVFRDNSSSPAPTISSTPSREPSASPSVSMSSSSVTLKNRMHQITLQTNFGDITFETYNADASNTVQNFITLAEKKFYNNLIFHRVIKGFMIQGGDPNGNGTGGPGYSFADELNPATESYKQGYVKGVVAMANAGSNTNGSQFFIMLENTALPHNYTIFGKVISGQNVVDAIGNVKTDSSDKPLEAVRIKNVSVKTK